MVPRAQRRSVLNLFAGIQAFLPSFLDPRALAWCERVAAHVPASARSHYLECRPGTASRIDFLSSFARSEVPLEYAARVAGAGSPSEAWQGNLRLLREWGRRGSLVSAAPYLWFEYDGPDVAPARGSLEASPSIGLEANYYARHGQALATASGGPQPRPLAAATLALLVPRSLAPGMWRAIDRCFAVLPPQGAVGYLSVMSARLPIAAKLFVILPRPDVLGFLARAQWPGDLQAAGRLLADFYAPSIRTAYLDITITDRVEERLGIATSQFHRGELAGTADLTRWARLPAGLWRETEQLLRWPGICGATSEGGYVVLQRWLDLKAVLEGGATQYKAYLGFMSRLPAIRESSDKEL